jgi:hypothetical protein
MGEGVVKNYQKLRHVIYRRPQVVIQFLGKSY